MKRFRIDFSIRETDCPPEEAQGIRFGDDVEVNNIFDFFNKCRDAAMTLFNAVRPKDSLALTDRENKLNAENVELKIKVAKLEIENQRLKQAAPAQEPWRRRQPWERYRDDEKYQVFEVGANDGLDVGSKIDDALLKAKERKGLL